MQGKYSRIITFLIGLMAIAAIAFAFFYPDASQGNELRQHDMMQGVANSHETVAYYEATGQMPRWTGSLFSGMPTFQINPHFPSADLFGWVNKAMGLGLPSPSSLLAMMMTGFFIMLLAMGMRWYVALLGAIGYGLSSYFVIIIGAGHLWKFITLAYVPPTIGGIILAYRGRYLAGAALAGFFAMMQIAGNHVQMSYYFAFVIAGVVIATLIMALRDHSMRRWCKATGALAVAAVLAIGANAPSLYSTYKYSKETMRGQHSELSASVSADTYDSSQYKARPTSGLDRDYITQYSYQPSESFTLLIPNVKGGSSARISGGRMQATSLADMPQANNLGQMPQQYIQYLSQYFGDPEGTNGPVYAGALIVALFLLGAITVRGPLKWALVILTILSLLLAWGRHAMWLTDLMIDFMPMYSKFRTVESILVIAEFTMPMLGAMALQQIVSTPRQQLKDKYMRPVLWSFGVPVFLCLVAWLIPGLYGSAITDNDMMIDSMISSQLMSQGYDAATARSFSLANPEIYSAVETLRYGLVKADALRSLLILLVGGGLLWCYLAGHLKVLPASLLICAVVLVDLYTVNKRYLDHDSFAPRQLTVGPPIGMTPADAQILRDSTLNYRVMDIPRFYSADPSYYHKTIGGYHAAKLTRYQDLIDRHLSAFTRGTQSDADWNVLNMLNARYVIGMDGQPLYNPEAYGNAWLIDSLVITSTPDAEMAALSAIDPSTTAVADRTYAAILGKVSPAAPGDTIYETTYAPDRLTYRVKSANGATAVFSEVFFPWGWTATVDGVPTPIARVNYLLRALKVPSGEHEIVMTFSPEAVDRADTLAKVSIILIYLACAAAIGSGVKGWLKRKQQ